MQMSIAPGHPTGIFVAAPGPRQNIPCRTAQAAIGEFALCLANAGEWVQIIGFAGRRGFHDRMAGIGLRIGTRVQVLSNPLDGKLLIDHAGTRLFLGGGMAHKIRVTRTEGEEE